MNKIKQNIHLLKENQLMQQEQIEEKCELLNLTRLETAENRKLKKNVRARIIANKCYFHFFVWRNDHAEL